MDLVSQSHHHKGSSLDAKQKKDRARARSNSRRRALSAKRKADAMYRSVISDMIDQ
jgi:hypothetical protein